MIGYSSVIGSGPHGSFFPMGFFNAPAAMVDVDVDILTYLPGQFFQGWEGVTRPAWSRIHIRYNYYISLLNLGFVLRWTLSLSSPPPSPLPFSSTRTFSDPSASQ